MAWMWRKTLRSIILLEKDLAVLNEGVIEGGGDTSQVAVSDCNVDPVLLYPTKRWQIGFIRQFMTIIAPSVL